MSGISICSFVRLKFHKHCHYPILPVLTFPIEHTEWDNRSMMKYTEPAILICASWWHVWTADQNTDSAPGIAAAGLNGHDLTSVQHCNYWLRFWLGRALSYQGIFLHPTPQLPWSGRFIRAAHSIPTILTLHSCILVLTAWLQNFDT